MPDAPDVRAADQADCATCDGSGKIRAGKMGCPDCSGTGTTTDKAAASPLLEWRRKKAADLSGLERRTFAVSDMEIRQPDDGGMLSLTGYASVTDTPYEVGFYTERIERGAFKRTLSEQPDVQLLVNHEGLPLARTKSGTLRLTEDDRGLKVDADLDPQDPDVMSLHRKMLRGDIDQMSFAFMATDQDWNDDFTERSIKAASIHRGDVSVVNQGANGSTVASIRSRETVLALQRIGPDGVIGGLAEWRDYTLLPLEDRAGKALSSTTMEVLSKVLELVQKSDDAGDQAIPMLAELMQVPNPNAQDTHDADGAPKADDDGPPPDGSSRAKQRAELREREMLLMRRARKAGK